MSLAAVAPLLAKIQGSACCEALLVQMHLPLAQPMSHQPQNKAYLISDRKPGG